MVIEDKLGDKMRDILCANKINLKNMLQTYIIFTLTIIILYHLYIKSIIKARRENLLIIQTLRTNPQRFLTSEAFKLT